jgi:hypothetical protein
MNSILSQLYIYKSQNFAISNNAAEITKFICTLFTEWGPSTTSDYLNNFDNKLKKNILTYS